MVGPQTPWKEQRRCLGNESVRISISFSSDFQTIPNREPPKDFPRVITLSEKEVIASASATVV